ncbi:hypothetical protein C7U89_22355 [Bradyrhizobium sp. WBOS4]|nr:hypothetical protein [Bradyrhizobium sp. WBOS8]MDD1585659.1 hypothetical protein [Bradyrhizobium sp. WBOS4]UUO49051.1 hypothetical protein DCM78_20325 [Bradyrhizobium sp. WBOS04]UUO62866.1 hypothetical protein DCM80_29200 [Bradyrhizobium sp. WBOS08]
MEQLEDFAHVFPHVRDRDERSDIAVILQPLLYLRRTDDSMINHQTADSFFKIVWIVLRPCRSLCGVLSKLAWL